MYYASVTDGNTPVADVFHRKNPRYPRDDLYLIQWPNNLGQVYGVNILYNYFPVTEEFFLDDREDEKSLGGLFIGNARRRLGPQLHGNKSSPSRGPNMQHSFSVRKTYLCASYEPPANINIPLSASSSSTYISPPKFLPLFRAAHDYSIAAVIT